MPAYLKQFLCITTLCPFLLLALSMPTLDAAEPGLRFNSRGILDLALPGSVASTAKLPIGTLDAASAQVIAAAPVFDETHGALVFSDEVYGCKPPSPACTRQHEQALLDASAGRARRQGGELILQPASGPSARFVDWRIATTASADGDEEHHFYLGAVPGSGYERVEVQFGHDAPGSFLLNPRNGKIAFVHNTSDVVEPAPDGLRLVTFNTLNPPLSLRVASLAADGPRRVLECAVREDDRTTTAQFRGWHDAHSFDLTLELHATRSKLAQRVAVRIGEEDGTWRVASAPSTLLAGSGFACAPAAR